SFAPHLLSSVTACSRLRGDRLGGAFEELTDAAKLLVALGQQLVFGLLGKFAEAANEIGLQPRRHLIVVAVGAAHRLFDHVVDRLQPLEMLRSQLERPGGHLREVVALPQDAGTPLGTDHGIVGVLEHGYTVAYANPQGSSRASFADDDANDRGLE